MEIIEEQEELYELTFDDVLFPDCGYAFPCDKEGRILWDKVSDPDEAKKSLAYCRAHPDEYTPRTRDGLVVQIIHRVRYGICPICGRRVYFGVGGWAYMGTAECECGQWYNVFGQAIKPPEEWPEEWPEEEEEDFFEIWP